MVPTPNSSFIMTGFAFGAHHQHVDGSALIHTILGSAMAAAGLARIIEISFVLKEGYGDQDDVKSWQHLYVHPASPACLALCLD